MSAILTTRPLSRAIAIAVRMCLVLSLWQAPIPWFHCHDASGEGASTKCEVDLRVHLAVWHSEPDHDLGWHLHWILPIWGHALDDTPDDEPPAEEAFAFDQALRSADDFSMRTPFVVALNTVPLLEMPGLIPVSHPFVARIAHQTYRPGANSVLRC